MNKGCFTSCRLLLLVGLNAVPLMLHANPDATTLNPTAQDTRPIEASMERLRTLNQQGAKAQQQVDKLADETDQAVLAYRNLLRKTDNLNRYNQQLQQIIARQAEDIAALQQQIATLEDTRRDIIPLMLDMLASLETFVRLDMPFLPDERQQRLATLKETLTRADVTTSEKYRQLLDAYLIEADYGRSIEAYQQALALADGERHVDVLRIGRIGLFYQTQDEQQLGFWNPHARTWQALPASYQQAIQQGLNMARRQAAPDLLSLPFVATQGGQP